MATNLQIDDALIAEAVRLGGHRTKRAAVTEALKEYNQHLRQLEILSAFGTIDFDPGYDYKKQRATRYLCSRSQAGLPGAHY